MRRDTWSEGYYTVVERIDCETLLYGKAFGYATIASGYASTAFGSRASASGNYAIASGVTTTASGDVSTAFGYQVTASGLHSVAIGSNGTTNLKTGSFMLSDFTNFASSSNDTINQMMMRFGGGYKLFTDPTVAPAITIVSNGSVGIGTTTPTQMLDVNGFINAQGATYTGPVTASYTANAHKTALFGYANMPLGLTTDYQSAGVTGFGEGNGIGSGINSYGVGIGVKGIGSLNSYSAIGVYAGLGTANANINVGGNYYALFADVTLAASGRYSAVFLNGNVGIGQSSPQHKLSITGGTDQAPLTISGGNAADLNGMIALAPGRAMTAIDEYLLMSGSGGGTQGSITGNASGGVSYNTTSDIRLKKDIRNSNFGLEQLMQIDVKDYKYISDPKQNLQTGFIAQQLYTVFPQAVTVGGIDAAKNPWQIDYSKLTPMLVKAVQELKYENEQEAKLNNILKINLAAMSDEIILLKEQVSKTSALEKRLLLLEQLREK